MFYPGVITVGGGGWVGDMLLPEAGTGSGLLEPKPGIQGTTRDCLGARASLGCGTGVRTRLENRPIRYGKIPGSHADVEFSPFQSHPVIAGAVEL